MSENTMYVFELREGESVTVGDAEVQVVDVLRAHSRIGIDAPPDVFVMRAEANPADYGRRVSTS